MIGEEGRLAVGGGLVEMAGAAVAFGGVVEEGITAHFGLGHARVAFEPGIVLAGVGVEAGILELVAGDGEHGFGDRHGRRGENGGAKKGCKGFGVGGSLQFCGDGLDGAAVHFEGALQRAHSLLLERVDAAVPEQAADGDDVGGAGGGGGGGFLGAEGDGGFGGELG